MKLSWVTLLVACLLCSCAGCTSGWIETTASRVGDLRECKESRIIRYRLVSFEEYVSRTEWGEWRPDPSYEYADLEYLKHGKWVAAEHEATCKAGSNVWTFVADRCLYNFIP